MCATASRNSSGASKSWRRRAISRSKAHKRPPSLPGRTCNTRSIRFLPHCRRARGARMPSGITGKGGWYEKDREVRLRAPEEDGKEEPEDGRRPRRACGCSRCQEAGVPGSAALRFVNHAPRQRPGWSQVSIPLWRPDTLSSPPQLHSKKHSRLSVMD